MAAKKRDQSPPRHTDKAVARVIRDAIKAGWAVEHPGSHAWGWLCCSGIEAVKPECRILIKSTPKGDRQAAILARELAKCPHGQAISKK